MKHLHVCAALLLIAAASLGSPGRAERAPSVPDFSFIHCSDIHVPPGVARKTGPPNQPNAPTFGSAEVVAQIKGLTGPIDLPPYRVTAPAPSFAIATGDLTEFGGGNGWWEDYRNLWQGAPFPVFQQSGNHDSTWACQRYRIRELHGNTYYSFDRNGCHFIGWDSATPQDPRPSFGEEGMRWLREDLKRVKKETPVFLFCHHPIDSKEFASLYERDRLLDALRPYNLALLLVGHGHAAQHRVVAGVDQVMGGSTFGNAPGYSVVSVQNGVLRVAYRKAWDAAPQQPLLERPLARRSDYPDIEIDAPRESATVEGSTVRIRAHIDTRGISAARWELDDETGRSGLLQREGDDWTATVDARGWAPGCHYLRITFVGALATAAGKSKLYQRTTRFYLEAPEKRVLWRAMLPGSVKGSPAVEGDLVVAGAGDGSLVAFSRRSGKQRWRFRTGGEILAQPLATPQGFYVGSGDGRFYAVDREGKQRWSLVVGVPVYSPAVLAEDRIIFAANNGHVYAVKPENGEKLWESTAPQYSIESRPVVHGGRVYYGCWDGYVYALDLADGSVRWKTQGAGAAASLPGVARYYSPADAAPAIVGERLWIADRMFRVSVLEPQSGARLEERKDVSSVAPSADGGAVYLRGTDGQLRKVAADGRELWSAPAQTNIVPSAPAEQEGVVFSTSATGRVFALDAGDGHRLWEYQATPGLYVFSDPLAREGVVYITGMDGSLTALRVR